MKASKRLKQSLAEIARTAGKIPLKDWLRGQPGSTRRGVARGTFKLPDCVIR